MAAVCQDADNDEPQPVDIDTEFVLGACRNLVVVDQLSICRFSHLSVREYFQQQHHWILDQADELVAKVYLLLLNHPSSWKTALWDKESGETEPLGRLLVYARSLWPEHLHKIGEIAMKDRLAIMLRKFLGPTERSGPAYRNWYSGYSKSYYQYEFQSNSCLRDNLNLLDPPTSALLPICIFGFEHIMEELCKAGKLDANQQNSKGYSLLALAARGGNATIAKLLLENGAEVNAQLGGRHGSVLAAAASAGSEATVRLLLENGADVNAQLGGDYGSALAAAAREGEKATVRLLLENGADVNAQLGGDYGSALAAAAWKGSEATVRLLLERGAELNRRGGPYGSVPNISAFQGRTDILRLLYDQYSGNRQLCDDQGRTPLHLAARGGHKEAFDYLVGSGLDPTVKDAKGDSITHYAASGAAPELLNEVLDKYYADLSQSQFWSPLHWAAPK